MLVKKEFTHKLNPSPRLSASQVAEYLSEGNATARRRIIIEAKYPPTCLLPRYDEVREALCKHLAKKHPTKDVLAEALNALSRKANSAGATDWTKGNYKIGSEAVAAFQGHERTLGLGKTEFRIPSVGYSRLSINGVTVSVSLDLVTEVANDNGMRMGGVIICLWKTRTSDIPQRCQAMAMLASEAIKKVLKDGQRCDPQMCMAIDVFDGKVYRAKAHQKTLYKTVEISCSEVATIWPSVKPPANYNGPMAQAS